MSDAEKKNHPDYCAHCDEVHTHPMPKKLGFSGAAVLGNNTGGFVLEADERVSDCAVPDVMFTAVGVMLARGMNFMTHLRGMGLTMADLAKLPPEFYARALCGDFGDGIAEPFTVERVDPNAVRSLINDAIAREMAKSPAGSA